jgi:hypothetical protein
MKKEGEDLIEDKDERFFNIGIEINPDALYWKGSIVADKKTIISSSKELEKRMKLEVFNLIVPLLSMPPEIFAKAVREIFKTYEEEPSDWLPDVWIQYLETGKVPTPPQPVMIDMNQEQTMKGGGANQAQTVVPKNEVPTPNMNSLMGSMGGGL